MLIAIKLFEVILTDVFQKPTVVCTPLNMIILIIFRNQPFSSHENVSEPQFSSSPSLHRDYGSDKDDFNRSYR